MAKAEPKSRYPYNDFCTIPTRRELKFLIFRLCQEMREHEEATLGRQWPHGASGSDSHGRSEQLGKRKTIRPDAYFSDEDASDEN